MNTTFSKRLAVGVLGAALMVAPWAGAADDKAEKDAPEAQPAVGGKLSIEKETLDLGDVVRGQTAKATFVLENRGTETLRILSAKPG